MRSVTAVMRSKLFVPGSRPELLAKALGSEADALSFDLEDSVVDVRKRQAREAVQALLLSDAPWASGKLLIVRVNALDTPFFADDVRDVARAGVAPVNLPKAQTPQVVMAAATAIERAAADYGLPAGGADPIRLLLNIETPTALLHAAELAAAHSCVAGLQLDLGDLFEPLGIARRDPAAVRQAMFLLRMAAGSAGVFAYDSAFADITDASGYRAEAEQARRLGFLGKSCFHPSQLALANAVFRPSYDEIAHAQKVMAAAAKAARSGAGAFVVDGRMVDRPFIDRARITLALATGLGLIFP